MSRMGDLDQCVTEIDRVLGDMERLMGGLKRRPLEEYPAIRVGMVELNREMAGALGRLGSALQPPPRS